MKPSTPLPVIFDCDPGNDDAAALWVSMASPEFFDILGITCVGGNAPLEQVSINARSICELVGREDIPVFAGCPVPLVKKPFVSDGAHGKTGMDGATLPLPTMKQQEEHAVDFIVRTLRESSVKITIMATGPLTNIAMALRMAPDIKKNIEEIVIMGGAIAAGNITPAAEFNFYVDPHAAYVVTNSGLKLTLIGLDVTHKIETCPEQLARLRALDSEPAQQVANMLECTQDFDKRCFEAKGRFIHDVCVPIFLMHHDLFKGRDASVFVDIIHHEHMGNTVTSFYPKHADNINAFVCFDVDAGGVFDVLIERLSRYSKSRD